MQFEEIVSVEEMGEGDTYDLEIDSIDHSFLANDISVSNSHAVAYAYLSYQCAHLFHYYPEEWICSYLENDPNKDAATAEVEALGYKIGQLDILTSGKKYSIINNVVYPPLSSVKGIGEAAIDELLDFRQKWSISESAKQNFESFFWDIESKILKNGEVKTKKTWKFTKFNKRALFALIRLEALWGLDLIPGMFMSHAHMLRVLDKYWSDKDKQKFDIEAACSDSQISTTDFTDAERVSAQHELLGTFDKNLLISEDVIDFLREQDILPLEDLSESSNKIWFILKDVSKETSQKGQEYWKLTISDIVGKEQRLNYFFGEPRGGWQKNSVYWAELYRNKGWINVRRGSFIKALNE
jgi:DNA polymerase III alpha subunit